MKSIAKSALFFMAMIALATSCQSKKTETTTTTTDSSATMMGDSATMMGDSASSMMSTTMVESTTK